MRPLLARFAAGLMALLPLAAAAEPFGYAAGFDVLYRIDLATGNATAVGPIGFNDVEGLSAAQNGMLYGVADATAGSGSGLTDLLIRIDPATGAGTLIGALSALQGQGPGGNLDYGLAFTCDQRLWLSSDTTNQFWEVSPATGATRFVGQTGQRVSGLAARGANLFGLSIGDNPTLYRIDPNTGAATQVGALGVGGVVDDAGLDFDTTGALWAVLDPEPAAEGSSRIARIDPLTGQGTVVSSSSIAQVGMEGLAIAAVPACNGTGNGNGNVGGGALPVPGPGLPLLALLGVLAAGLGARRIARERGEA
jgi:hypothetical protein